ncbi:MAG: hypothetical protein QXI12_05975 [Candidatus Methanomethyliaceae archaeon]
MKEHAVTVTLRDNSLEAAESAYSLIYDWFQKGVNGGFVAVLSNDRGKDRWHIHFYLVAPGADVKRLDGYCRRRFGYVHRKRVTNRYGWLAYMHKQKHGRLRFCNKELLYEILDEDEKELIFRTVCEGEPECSEVPVDEGSIKSGFVDKQIVFPDGEVIFSIRLIGSREKIESVAEEYRDLYREINSRPKVLGDGKSGVSDCATVLRRVKGFVVNKCCNYDPSQFNTAHWCWSKDRACVYCEPWGGFRCSWFELFVLPGDKELEADYFALISALQAENGKQEKIEVAGSGSGIQKVRKQCLYPGCGEVFLASSNRQKYCPSHQHSAARERKRLWAAKGRDRNSCSRI